MEFRPSRNLPEQIAQHLCDRIIRFELKPGERIVEEDLAQNLGVSRSPLREALRILEKKWLVDLVPRREARVSTLNEGLILATGDILIELYTLVARKATALGTDGDRELLSASLEECRNAARRIDPSVYFEAIIRYEELSLKAARNIVLVRLLRDLWPPSRRVQFATLHLRSESLVDHVRFFERAHEFLLEGDEERASAAVRDLIESEIAFGVKYLPRFTEL